MGVTVSISIFEIQCTEDLKQLIESRLKEAGADLSSGTLSWENELGSSCRTFTWISDREGFEYFFRKQFPGEYDHLVYNESHNNYGWHELNDMWESWQAALRFAWGAE